MVLHFIIISISILQAFLADRSSGFDSTTPTTPPSTTSQPQVIKKLFNVYKTILYTHMYVLVHIHHCISLALIWTSLNCTLYKLYIVSIFVLLSMFTLIYTCQ